MTETVAAVVIGRNEGERLIACLDALAGKLAHIVYVDSGSSDGSVAAAQSRGANVVALDMTQPFTAARARNAGVAYLDDHAIVPDYIQFLDGDCIVQPGWLEAGADFLTQNPNVAAVCGRNRERFPDRSIYNGLADTEWNTPVGEARATGGNVMMRRSAFAAEGGFDPSMIAGEEPELCLRMRNAGWKIWRIEHEMTLHDANLLKFSQWWQRTKRGGYAAALAVDMHGQTPERYGVARLIRIVGWGLVLPATILVGLLITPWAALLALLWPIQILRRRAKGDVWVQAVFTSLTKIPEGQGVVLYLWRKVTRSGPKLIEHK